MRRERETQAAMDACANNEPARVNAELNDIYHKLLAKAAGLPAAVAKVAPPAETAKSLRGPW